MKERLFRLADVVGPVCVDLSEADALADAIGRAFEAGERVRLSFSGVEHMSLSFMNHAFGALYGAFGAERVRAHLAPPEDASERLLALLKTCAENARRTFAAPPPAEPTARV